MSTLATQWLAEALRMHMSRDTYTEVRHIVEMALDMERDNIIDAYDQGATYIWEVTEMAEEPEPLITGTQYFNTNYK